MLFLSFIELVILKSYGDNIPVVKREWFVWGYDRLILVFATQPRYHCDLHQTRKIKIPFWRKADTMQCTTIDRWQHCRSMIDTYRIVAISWPSYGLTWAVNSIYYEIIWMSQIQRKKNQWTCSAFECGEHDVQLLLVIVIWLWRYI